MAAVAGIVSTGTWRSELIGHYSLPRLRLSFSTSLLRGGFRRPLVIRCSGADASETPKPKPRRRKKADDPSAQPKQEEEAVTPKVTKRQSRASAAASPRDSDEQPLEKPKKKRAAPKRKVVEATAVEVEVVDDRDGTKAEAVVARTKRKSKKENDRWKIMEGEKLKVIEGKNMADVEVVYESEEEEDDDQAEDELEDEEKQEGDLDVVDMNFPDKECYALISSYKPRKVAKDERPPLTNDELWWNWKNRRPDEHVWSEFQKRPGLPDITMAAMAALTGQIKLFGDTPTVTETHIYRARKFVFKEERLAAEAKRRDEIGAMAYYHEWVKAWDKDTSKEAVQKHYEETGEDVALQLMNMLACQTQREYRQMMGTDVRIRRDPLVMRATREMKRSVFGGDPVYPTINYRKKPDEIPDYRGPNFHQPRPNLIEHLIRGGRMKTRAEHNRIMALQQQRLEAAAARAEEDEAVVEEMAAAIDIGDKDIEEEDDEEEDDVDVDAQLKEEIISVPTEKLIELAQEEDEDEEGNI
ncbi:protein PLASTID TRANSCRIPTIONALLY ACTIVE 12, chloroplastic-like [Selaginella moellendorffii]|uniref:protein PLASTID TRANSCRIPTIONALLY ACTIVE 12, chloroplastic-like n=1 Tax=Selaginella moellendorffii TaxID=88036 RepID=UPI000D1C94B9|nr:protein PLASTID TRANSCRIPTIONALLY ACTIVE 12, chloroplastic-like [Selaginella moellendorffii]|eukprot:XP_024525277.1 protein PLASTID TRANSCRIPTIONALLY ACTIVE 12, chloroplastic-like [Selaginella moellendorffii]